MYPTRPKNLNLFTIRFPLPAIVSILHRISGFILFLSIPVFLWIFSMSLTEPGFDALRYYLDNFFTKLAIWAILAGFCFHFVAGIRHLLMDVHIGSSLKGGKFSALLVMVISIVLILCIGIWLW